MTLPPGFQDHAQSERDGCAAASPEHPSVRLAGADLPPPLVSLVLVSWNRAAFIGAMIDSIRRQDYSNFECFVVDNASVDDSRAVIGRHVGDDPRFSMIFLECNRGQLGAFLHIFERLRGEFVGVVDDDDVLFPNFLSSHLQVHLALPKGVGFTSNDVIQIAADGSALGGHTPPFVSGSEYGVVGLLPIDRAPRLTTVSDQYYQRLSARSSIMPPSAVGWLWSPTAVLFRRAVMDIALPESSEQSGQRGCDTYFKPFCHMLAGSAVIDLPLFARRIHGNNDFASMPSVIGLRYGRPDTASREMGNRYEALRSLLARAASFNRSLIGEDRYWEIIDQHTLGAEKLRSYFARPEVTALFVEHYDRLVSVFGEAKVLRELRKRYRFGTWLHLIRRAHAGNLSPATAVEMLKAERSRLRSRWRRKIAPAPTDALVEQAPPRPFNGAILSRDPLIVLASTGKGPDGNIDIGLADRFWDRFGNRPATFLIVPSHTIESEATTMEMHRAADRCRPRCMHHEVIFLCNSAREMELLRQAGETPLLLNKNVFTSELTFHPIPGAPIEFDAVYNASLSPVKRHELAVMIPRVAYVTYYHHGLGSKSEVQPRLDLLLYPPPGHQLINPVRDGLPVYMPLHAINKVYGRAAVGLCLSAVEGPMQASMEYMLAGLPVVSTPSIGGRDHFFDPEYCLVVEPDPRQIRDAVLALRDRAISREYIRARTLAKLKAERMQFLALLDQILERRGAPRRFGSEWPYAASPRVVQWKSLEDHWADIAAG
jgi:glycosyltransferase involved in cell wall biosynthesis